MANQLPTGVWWHFNQLSPYPVTGGDGMSVGIGDGGTGKW